jgi:transmembrane 9 superfamily protein 3
MMVLFLIGLVIIILLRTLRKDYARYEKEDFMDLNHELGDEYGWKQVHGDVFRSPMHLSILSSLLGTGTQLIVLGFAVISYTIMSDLYLERSTMLTASIFLYALTSFVSGYISLNHYTRYGGKKWIRTLVITSLLFPGVISIIGGSVNLIAIYYNLSRVVPFNIMIAIAAIWLFLVFPLNLLGAIIGKNYVSNKGLPCRVNPIPRPIPDKVWYAEPLVIIALGGILPFGSIFIEMYFIFASFWAYKVYYVYGFMLVSI